MPKSHHILLSIILYSLSYSVETESVNTADETFVNEKFKFIQDIYSESWALIIGINRYQYVEPLPYAVDDAEAVIHVVKISENDLRKQQVNGFYTDIELTKPVSDVNADKVVDKKRELEGTSRSTRTDNI